MMTAPGAEHCAGCRGFTRPWDEECPGLTLEAILMAYACHPDSRDRPASLASDFLATLAARAENPGLLWRELVAGKPGGSYWQDWYCEPPPSGAGFRVHPGRDEWTAEEGSDMTVRRIYAIEVIDAAAEERARPGSRSGGVRAADGAGTGAAGQLAPPGFTDLTAPPPQERPDGTGGGP